MAKGTGVINSSCTKKKSLSHDSARAPIKLCERLCWHDWNQKYARALVTWEVTRIVTTEKCVIYFHLTMKRSSSSFTVGFQLSQNNDADYNCNDDDDMTMKTLTTICYLYDDHDVDDNDDINCDDNYQFHYVSISIYNLYQSWFSLHRKFKKRDS